MAVKSHIEIKVNKEYVKTIEALLVVLQRARLPWSGIEMEELKNGFVIIHACDADAYGE